MLAFIVTVIVATLILKQYKAQTVLFVGGLVLMGAAVLMGYPLLDAKKTTGFVWFDLANKKLSLPSAHVLRVSV